MHPCIAYSYKYRIGQYCLLKLLHQYHINSPPWNRTERDGCIRHGSIRGMGPFSNFAYWKRKKWSTSTIKCLSTHWGPEARSIKKSGYWAHTPASKIPEQVTKALQMGMNNKPVRVAEWVEHPPPALGDRGIWRVWVRIWISLFSNPGRVKPMTFKLMLVTPYRSALLG